MRALGWNIDEDAIRGGLKSVYWPGRFDIVSRQPMVVLDCAHNELSIQALLETIAVELGREVKPRLIFGCLETKTWERMAAMLGPRVRDVTLTMAKPKRPLEPENLAPVFSRYGVPHRVERDPMRAIEMVMGETAPGDMVLGTGSVYLIGEIYQYFLAREGRRSLFPEAGK